MIVEMMMGTMDNNQLPVSRVHVWCCESNTCRMVQKSIPRDEIVKK